MELTEFEEFLVDKLKSYTLTRKQLIRLTGFGDRRNRLIINKLRKKGIPIISSSHEKGYRLARNYNECKNFAKEIMHRVKEEQAIAKGVLCADEKYFKE